MKKILFILTMLFTLNLVANATEVKDSTFTREGTNFTTKKSNNHSGKYIETKYTFTDSKGIVYPILINTTSGHCKVMKTSKTTGKQYAYYLSQEMCEEICKEMDITYIPSKPRDLILA